mmetsp:Transcript_99986/g.282268  ORF Transcript_99986/g.282268 Transcript_99986/m.282268 type:complete len:185 (+) Transcript_99986:345-899(+)
MYDHSVVESDYIKALSALAFDVFSDVPSVHERCSSSDSCDVDAQSTEAGGSSCSFTSLSDSDASSAIGATEASLEMHDPVPEFSGRWMLAHIEGDMDAVMSDAGVRWAARRLARRFDYGVGVISLSIEQDKESLSIESIGSFTAPVTRLVISAGVVEQETFGEASAISREKHWFTRSPLREGNL